MHTPMNTPHRDVGNELVMRWSTAEDTDRIANLHGMVHRNAADGPPNNTAMRVIRRLMHGDHPFMGSYDFAVIEDTSREGNPVVACTCLWRHTWTYEGIPFSVGRPEMVATDAAYRHRGLVRALFEMVHERSEAEGDLVQAITGISYFYRQFGYEYALELEDRRTIPLALIPKAKEDASEPFMLREATGSDIPEIAALYNRRRASSIVSESMTRKQWLYEIESWKAHPHLGHRLQLQMIVDAVGRTVGFVALDTRRHSKELGVWLLEFAPGVNMQTVMPSVLRALSSYGLGLELVRPDVPPLRDLNFYLGSTHPIYEVLGNGLQHAMEPPYARYVRVKDLPAFLLHIAPALEQRLATSPVVGHSGEIRLDIYRGGLRMVARARTLDGCGTLARAALRLACEWWIPSVGLSAGTLWASQHRSATPCLS